MNLDPDDQIKFFKRILITLIILILAVIMLNSPIYFLSPFVFLWAAIVMGPSIADIIAQPFKNLIFPVKYHEQPLPPYGKGKALVKQNKLHEAIIHYRQIIADYPEELTPYIEIMRIQILHLKDQNEGQQTLEEALEYFENNHEELTKYFETFTEALQTEQNRRQTNHITTKDKTFKPPPIPKRFLE